MSPARAAAAAARLLDWMDAREWRGHDPFDLLLSPLAAPFRPFRWPSVAWIQVGKRSPVDLRPLLRVPPHENPKALALGVEGCLALVRSGDAAARDAAVRRAPGLLTRLLDAEAPEGGWGYPFPWANRHFLAPAGTPSGVVTSFVTRALMAALDADARDGSAARGTALLPGGPPRARVEGAVVRGGAFAAERLRRVPTPEGPLLSYTPLDRRGVHNASLLAAAAMARGASLPGGDPAWAETARAVAASTLRAQRPDGSWPYGVSRRDGFVDSYHTGYVLTALAEVDARVGLEGTAGAAERGLSYWRRAFLAGPAVGPRPDRPYPVELHAVAQGILTLLEAGDGEEARRLVGWALDHALLPDGAFVHSWAPGRVNAVPYLRWVQAWMFRALAEAAAP